MEHNFKLFPELTNNQMGLFYWESPHQQIMEDFWATVVRVKDGDTIQVRCNFRDFDFPVRFINIMAAELNEPNGIESRNWLASKILGQEVEIKIDQRNRVGKWGRLLGRVEQFGMDLGEESKAMGMSIGIEEEEQPKDLIKLLLINTEWD